MNTKNTFQSLMNKSPIYIFFTIILTACTAKYTGVPINKNLKGGIYESAKMGEVFYYYDANDSAIVDTASYIPFDDFHRAYRMASSQTNIPPLRFLLKENVKDKFRKMTERNVNRPLFLVVDRQIMAAPILQNVITTGDLELSFPDKEKADLLWNYLTN